MNRLIAQFSLQIQNSPERVIVAGDPSKAYIVNRYKVYGVITLFLIEDRFRTDSATDRLNAIAQVIAEAQSTFPSSSDHPILIHILHSSLPRNELLRRRQHAHPRHPQR